MTRETKPKEPSNAEKLEMLRTVITALVEVSNRLCETSLGLTFDEVLKFIIDEKNEKQENTQN